MAEHAQWGFDSRISQRLKVKVHKIKFLFIQYFKRVALLAKLASLPSGPLQKYIIH